MTRSRFRGVLERSHASLRRFLLSLHLGLVTLEVAKNRLDENGGRLYVFHRLMDHHGCFLSLRKPKETQPKDQTFSILIQAGGGIYVFCFLH